ncbi:uncharacterized protein LOC118191899 [Stegodyphus dumicola]|uniref:uncharacterized protein LOC118191899 n=1 Tax=Stegodyphus dumicola TaxID=202533 RepID=UPI0015AE7039|nr:uncharacterized protein LOC118191899 [Stegodyphus dumicola]
MQSLRKIIARRGRPSIINLDNGTNFMGTNNLFQKINWKEVDGKTTIKKIKWKFNPPTSAWWGGWWKRLIRIIKDMLKSILGRTSLGYEELLTVLYEVETVVNSRPLTYISEDIQDLMPLNSNMFLRDNVEGSTIEFDHINGIELNKRWQYRQKLREDLRKRFRAEYLG